MSMSSTLQESIARIFRNCASADVKSMVKRRKGLSDQCYSTAFHQSEAHTMQVIEDVASERHDPHAPREVFVA